MIHTPAPLGILSAGGRSPWPGEAGATAALAVDASRAQVLDFVQRYVKRALNERVRYRYVQPTVRREGDALRVEAPCCSRNVDPAGGVIDIALLTPAKAGGWQLQARDHAAAQWRPERQAGALDELLDVLCVDAQRIFWP